MVGFTALGSSCAMLSCSAKCIKKEMPPCCGERIYIITTNSENYNARWQTSGEVFFPEYTLLVLSKKPWGMVVYSESTTVYNFCKFLTPKYYSRVKSLWELNIFQSDSLNDFLNDTLCDCFCWREIMRNSPGGKKLKLKKNSILSSKSVSYVLSVGKNLGCKEMPDENKRRGHLLLLQLLVHHN